MQDAYKNVPPLAESQSATATGLESPGINTCIFRDISALLFPMLGSLSTGGVVS